MIRSYDKKLFKDRIACGAGRSLHDSPRFRGFNHGRHLGGCFHRGGQYFPPAAARHSLLYPFSCFLRDSSCFPGRRAE